MDYRNFWLTNSVGNRYDLISEENYRFFHKPKNLGFKKIYTTERLGNELVITKKLANMPNVSGELLFYNPTNIAQYEAYQAFIQFIKMTPLQLHYQTPNSFDNLYIECEAESVEKSEIEHDDNMLHCDIDFYGLSFWKEDVEHDLIVNSGLIGNGKQIPYTYPYKYSGNSYQNINIQNNGTIDTGFKFLIESLVTNPVLQLFYLKGEEYVKYGEIKINGTYDYVYVNTIDTEQSIVLKLNGSTIANPTSYFDLSGDGTYETPFPKLKVGQSKLAFSFGGSFSSSIHIKWQDNFISY